PEHALGAPAPHWCGGAPGHVRLFSAAMPERIVIVGAGQAAASAADVLRRRGFKGTITLIGEEPSLPYQRPPLSKKYLTGEMERERLLIRPAKFYADHAIEARLGRRALAIDRSGHSVALDDGSTVAYDALLLATGARPRPIDVPGANLAGVHVLRNLADVDGIRARIRHGGRSVYSCG